MIQITHPELLGSNIVSNLLLVPVKNDGVAVLV